MEVRDHRRNRRHTYVDVGAAIGCPEHVQAHADAVVADGHFKLLMSAAGYVEGEPSKVGSTAHPRFSPSRRNDFSACGSPAADCAALGRIGGSDW